MAGVLAAAVVILAMKDGTSTDDVLRALGALLAVLALLVGVDVIAWISRRRH